MFGHASPVAHLSNWNFVPVPRWVVSHPRIVERSSRRREKNSISWCSCKSCDTIPIYSHNTYWSRKGYGNHSASYNEGYRSSVVVRESRRDWKIKFRFHVRSRKQSWGDLHSCTRGWYKWQLHYHRLLALRYLQRVEIKLISKGKQIRMQCVRLVVLRTIGIEISFLICVKHEKPFYHLLIKIKYKYLVIPFFLPSVS